MIINNETNELDASAGEEEPVFTQHFVSVRGEFFLLLVLLWVLSLEGPCPRVIFPGLPV